MKKEPGNIKRKVGRPSKYNEIDLVQIEKLAGMGLTEEQISDVLGVKDDTLRAYKKKHPEFLGALKRGKARANLQVKKSLFQRAIGYDAPDLYITHHKGKIITKEITKHYPPDVGAIAFWLKNRERDQWKDRWDLEVSIEKETLASILQRDPYENKKGNNNE